MARYYTPLGYISSAADFSQFHTPSHVELRATDYAAWGSNVRHRQTEGSHRLDSKPEEDLESNIGSINLGGIHADSTPAAAPSAVAAGRRSRADRGRGPRSNPGARG